MNPQVHQALALNLYAREGRYISEGWASDHFKKTFAQALAACKDVLDTSMGVTVSWSHTNPEQVCVTRTNLASERTSVVRMLPLEGSLAEALLADLQARAVVRATQDIRDERERALLNEAVSRVARLMVQAATEESAPVE